MTTYQKKVFSLIKEANFSPSEITTTGENGKELEKEIYFDNAVEKLKGSLKLCFVVHAEDLIFYMPSQFTGRQSNKDLCIGDFCNSYGMDGKLVNEIFNHLEIDIEQLNKKDQIRSDVADLQEKKEN